MRRDAGMELQKAFMEVKKGIAEGRRLWEGQRHMQGLYDAQMIGVEQAKFDVGKASRLGTNIIQFMRSQLQAMDSTSAWSMPQLAFERTISIRIGYRAAFDAIGRLLAEERTRNEQRGHTVLDRSISEISL
jgi:hypothetical protein